MKLYDILCACGASWLAYDLVITSPAVAAHQRACQGVVTITAKWSDGLP